MVKRPITNYPNAPDIESSTQDYATRFGNDVGKWFLRCQKDVTQKLIKGVSLTVLDVGGGHGQNVDTITELGHSLTIIGSHESPTTMIQDAIDNKTITFEIGNVLDLPYEDKSFDIVISYRMLSHMDQWSSFIDELSRVAKTLVIVDYPSKHSFNILYNILYFVKKRFEANTREFNFYSCKEISHRFEKDHFKLNSQYKQFFLPMALHRKFGTCSFSETSEKLFRAVKLTDAFGSPVIISFKRS